MSRLWILPVLAFIAALGLACSDQGDDLSAAVTTASPTASASLSSTSPSDTVSSITTPTPGPSLTVATDWAEYADPDGRFKVNFPSNWFLEDGGLSKVRPPGELTTVFSSFLPGTVTEFPATALKVDLIVYSPTLDNDCRSSPDGATTNTLGGVSAWQLITPKLASGEGRSTLVAAYHDGFCYSLTGYFGSESRDDETFQEIVDSLKFSSQ
jgi:hypothetical protein